MIGSILGSLFLGIISLSALLGSLYLHFLGLRGDLDVSIELNILVSFVPISLIALFLLCEKCGLNPRLSKFTMLSKLLIAIAVLYSFYTGIYIMFIINKGGTPAILNGSYVLHNHGTIIEQLDFVGYQLHRSYTTSAYALFGIVSGTFVLMSCISAVTVNLKKKYDVTINPAAPSESVPDKTPEGKEE